MKLITFPQALTTKRTANKSQFLKDLKQILTYLEISFLDPCCPTTPAESPLRFDVTGQIIQYFNGTDWVSVPPVATSATFSQFYGLTTGTGNGGPNDYASTVPVKTSAGTGRVPFPRNGAFSVGSATRIDSSSFTLPNIGIYEVFFEVHTIELGQLQLELAGAAIPSSTVANMNSAFGGHPIIGNTFITTTSANETLAVINPAGNATALTITPANGSETNANAQTLIIKQVG
jgi:hypothetical protein